MKMILTMLIGLGLGCVICYLMIPVLGLNHFSTDTKAKEPTKKIEPRYTHDEEGIRLQTLEMLDISDYTSTEGNSAELFALDHQCKIRVNIVGETYYRYRTFYFRNQNLIYAMQSMYRYPNGGLSNMDAPDAFKEEFYSKETLNPQSSAVIAEFETLKGRFAPHYLTKC